MRGERLRQAWQEDREAMLARLAAARERAAEVREERAQEVSAAFMRWLERQAVAFCRDREAPRQVRYGGRCESCGAYLQIEDTREALAAQREREHGEGRCSYEQRAAHRREDRSEARRVKHSRRLAHRAAIVGISIVGGSAGE